EAWLGVPPPVPGEGTHWRLEAEPFLGDAASGPWPAVAVAVAAAALVVGVYLREGRSSRVGYRLLLAGFRLGLVFLALAVLLPQLRLLFERQSWPDVAILIDDSASMGTVDQYQDERVRAAVAGLARDQGLAAPGRLQ